MKRRQTVKHVRDTLGRDVVTDRQACRVLGQARNTQHRLGVVRRDESFSRTTSPDGFDLLRNNRQIMFIGFSCAVQEAGESRNRPPCSPSKY